MSAKMRMELFVGAIVVSVVCFAAGSESLEGKIKTYEVNRLVSSFSEVEDLSTPESAYATLNRLSASGDRDFWARLSVDRLARRMSTGQDRRQVSEDRRREFLESQILEVRIVQSQLAVVWAKVPHPWKQIIDARYLELENHIWRNAGNDVFGSLDQANAKFMKMCGRHVGLPKVEPVSDPEQVLDPYVQYLEEKAEDPKTLVLRALNTHQITIMGEVHHRPRYWAFNSALISDPAFAENVGTLYMELPMHNQDKTDAFLAGSTCDRSLVIDILRDMLWMGWPDQGMLKFFEAVWYKNQALPENQRLRIVLVDMARPWSKIKEREDWRQYDCDRDKLMADNIKEDRKAHSNDMRHGLFLVGVGHTALGARYYGGVPDETAGWHLVQALGREQIYAITQHQCVMTNMGRVDGRLCLGLFDSAFAQLNGNATAFGLAEGPFGQQRYDASPDADIRSTYADGFDAYLYLGPLETESFSPLIRGFYTDAFVQELERRHRIMYGKSWSEAYGQDRADAEHFEAWMSKTWGQPRKWTHRLGPLNAWHHGDGWEKALAESKAQEVFASPEQITEAARHLFTGVQEGDYERHASGANWRHFLSDDVDYQVYTNFPAWVRWVCATFSKDPIKTVNLSDVTRGDDGLPSLNYTVTLTSARVLKGTLAFEYLPREGRWTGKRGLDWHIQYPDELPAQTGKSEQTAKQKKPDNL